MQVNSGKVLAPVFQDIKVYWTGIIIAAAKLRPVTIFDNVPNVLVHNPALYPDIDINVHCTLEHLNIFLKLMHY